MSLNTKLQVDQQHKLHLLPKDKQPSLELDRLVLDLDLSSCLKCLKRQEVDSDMIVYSICQLLQLFTDGFEEV